MVSVVGWAPHPITKACRCIGPWEQFCTQSYYVSGCTIHTHTDTAPLTVIIQKYELHNCNWSLSFMCSLTTKLPKQCVSCLSWFFMLQCLLESCRCCKIRVFAVRCQHLQNMEKLHMELDNIWGWEVRERRLPWWKRIQKVKWWVAYVPRLTSIMCIICSVRTIKQFCKILLNPKC